MKSIKFLHKFIEFYRFVRTDNYHEISAGAIEAYKRVKENVNYLMVRYHAIDALEQQIGKVSATAIFAKAEKNPNTPISKFILGTE